MIDIENSAGNFEQALSVSIPATKDYVDLIDNQAKSINPSIDPDDVFSRFMKDIIGIEDVSVLEDNSIYIDDTIDDLTKRCLYFFQDEIASVLDDDLGVHFQEPTLFLLKALYNVLVYKISDYFIYFINGLQKTNDAFSTDMPDFESYKYDYFLQKVSKKESEYQNIQDYIQYILSFNFSFSNYISVALLESAGNVDLSAIFIEDANYRLSADDNFVFQKIKSIVLSPDINDYIVVRVLDMIGKTTPVTSDSTSGSISQVHD